MSKANDAKIEKAITPIRIGALAAAAERLGMADAPPGGILDTAREFTRGFDRLTAGRATGLHQNPPPHPVDAGRPGIPAADPPR